MEFPAELQSLSEILAFVRAPLERTHSQEVLERLELVAEEALVNIIQHGYAGNEGWITISCISQNDSIVLNIQDGSIPFDWAKEIDRLKAFPELNSRKGCGLQLIAHYASHVSYERVSGKNCFSIHLTG